MLKLLLLLCLKQLYGGKIRLCLSPRYTGWVNNQGKLIDSFIKLKAKSHFSLIWLSIFLFLVFFIGVIRAKKMFSQNNLSKPKYSVLEVYMCDNFFIFYCFANTNIYMGGISQDVKRQKNLGFLHFILCVFLTIYIWIALMKITVCFN